MPTKRADTPVFREIFSTNIFFPLLIIFYNNVLHVFFVVYLQDHFCHLTLHFVLILILLKKISQSFLPSPSTPPFRLSTPVHLSLPGWPAGCAGAVWPAKHGRFLPRCWTVSFHLFHPSTQGHSDTSSGDGPAGVLPCPWGPPLPHAVQVRIGVHVTDVFRRVPAFQLPLVGQMPSRCLSGLGTYIFIISVKKDRSSSPGCGLVTSDR